MNDNERSDFPPSTSVEGADPGRRGRAAMYDRSETELMERVVAAATHHVRRNADRLGELPGSDELVAALQALSLHRELNEKVRAERGFAATEIDVFMDTADLLGLTLEERERLIGGPIEGTLKPAQRVRSGHLSGIAYDLRTLFHDAVARRWLRTPHDSEPFAGRAPIDLMLEGQEGLAAVRRYVDDWATGPSRG